MSSFAKRITHPVYFEYHPDLIAQILDFPMVKVHIATPTEDPETILGYLAASAVRAPKEDKQEVVLHYLFVKKEFQLLGVARRLMDELHIQEGDDISFTHWTYPMDEISKKRPTWVYNPYLI